MNADDGHVYYAETTPCCSQGNTADIIPLLVEALKEQQIKIEQLQRRLEASGL